MPINLDNIQDTDWLCCTDDDGVSKKVSGAAFKELFGTKGIPWDDHDGGVWHVKNATGPVSLIKGPNKGPFTAWDVDGTNERQVTELQPGEEFVFITPPDSNRLFKSNKNVNWEYGELNDTSRVTNMEALFYMSYEFNSDISDWDTSSVTNMVSMFGYTNEFNSDISKWNVSSVENMHRMFYSAYAFNSPVGEWDISSCTDISEMFSHAFEFDQDISEWDISNVEKLYRMFYEALKFNKDISNWDVSKITDMDRLFYQARDFNQDLTSWCVSQIPDAPNNFSTDSGMPADGSKDPVWGTCP